MTEQEIKLIDGVQSLTTKIFMALAMQPCIDLPKLIKDVEMFEMDDDSAQAKQLNVIINSLRDMSSTFNRAK